MRIQRTIQFKYFILIGFRQHNYCGQVLLTRQHNFITERLTCETMSGVQCTTQAVEKHGDCGKTCRKVSCHWQACSLQGFTMIDTGLHVLEGGWWWGGGEGSVWQVSDGFRILGRPTSRNPMGVHYTWRRHTCVVSRGARACDEGVGAGG